jgi:putative mycofactocin binding protein MftB
LSDQRLRWSADVQIRSERFGAIAYDSKAQRLMLMQSTMVTQVANLLVGEQPAWLELSPLGCDGDEIEHLLIQLYKESVVEVADDRATPTVARVNSDGEVLE